jgi:hypothetical protein
MPNAPDGAVAKFQENGCKNTDSFNSMQEFVAYVQISSDLDGHIIHK